jgi:hypothetical protein
LRLPHSRDPENQQAGFRDRSGSTKLWRFHQRNVMKLSAGISFHGALMRLVHWDDIRARTAKFWRQERCAAATAHALRTRCATLSICAIGSGALWPILFAKMR